MTVRQRLTELHPVRILKNHIPRQTPQGLGSLSEAKTGRQLCTP